MALIERAFVVDDSYMLYGAYRVLAGFWGGFPKIPFIKYRQNLPLVLSYICHVINEPGYCQDCPNCPASLAASVTFSLLKCAGDPS